MRILFLTQFFQPEPIFKGLPFARALRERGHSVEVLTGFPNYPGGRIYPGYRVRWTQRETLDGIPVVRVPLFPSHDRSAVQRMANYLSFSLSAGVLGPRLTQRPDVIYVYNLVTLAPAWRRLRRRHRCAVVLDVQDLWPESVAASGMLGNPLLNRMLGRWCRSAYANPERLTALSPGFKRHLAGTGVSPDRIEVIHNWCEELPTARTDAEIRALRREAGFEGRFNVLFSGTMGRVQALDTVIEAARSLRDSVPGALFSFMGGGVEVERLKERAAGLENVRFLPKRPPAEALALASAADALLVHLKDDPLFAITIPSKTQAYLYAGRPILMGVRGDAADLVREAGAGMLFEPENPGSLAEAVRALAALPGPERDRMGANGRRYYERNLSFACGVSRFEKVFQAACDARR